MSKKPDLGKKRTYFGMTLPTIGWIIVAIIVVGVVGSVFGAG